MDHHQIRVLSLKEGDNLDATLFRLEKGWVLHFVLGTSLTDKHVRVFVNHPLDSKAEQNRHIYREVQWQNISGHVSDIYDNFAEVVMVQAGSFNYYFTLDGSDHINSKNGSGYFLVDPILVCGSMDDRVPLDCVTCQTVLSKSLGPFPEWEQRLLVSRESGYNMVHFTPLQELGASNSSYAIKDQLSLNPVFSKNCDGAYDFDDIRRLLCKMRSEWGVMSLTDLVYNHTANESPWLRTHPEAVYSVVTSPHLRPAYLLDRALWHLTRQCGAGLLEAHGLPAEISTEAHLDVLRAMLWKIVFPTIQLYEFYTVDIDRILSKFKESLATPGVGNDVSAHGDLEIIPDSRWRRLRASVDLNLALKLYNKSIPGVSEEQRQMLCCEELRARLEKLNEGQHKALFEHLQAAADNVVANARWRFVNPHGDRCGVVSEKEPIMWNYFILPPHLVSLLEEEQYMDDVTTGGLCMAHNGWVMGDDPLRNFAEPGSNVYLRRELLPWGDSVKLRYGKSPEDCPYLWEHMRQYTRLTAKLFDGVRLDNCHSTPVHVAEYMLDEARKVRPDLYVVAELFTSSEYKDNIFINRLGLNSLIREAMSAHDSHDLGRLVHRYAGQPVGAFIQPPARPLVSSMAHAIFVDQTHDNASPAEKRTVFDALSTAALVSMACCASASNRGYDELVPHHINVVHEDRLYTLWSDNSTVKEGHVSIKSGIIAAKRSLNKLHQDLARKGFNQVYVDQITRDVVSVTRHNETNHGSVILVARTAFNAHALKNGDVPESMVIPGVLDKILLEAYLHHDDDLSETKSSRFISGLYGYKLCLQEGIDPSDSHMVKLATNEKGQTELKFSKLPPGSFIVVKVSQQPQVKSSVLTIRQCLSHFGYRMRTYSGRNLAQISGTEIEAIVAKLDFNDLNRVLFRCGQEEVADGVGGGPYDVPGFGQLPYCGLQGLMAILSVIRARNDLGHPLCNNLREGNWLMDYTANRLIQHPSTKRLGEWLKNIFSHVYNVPRYLIPCYFDAIITGVYMLVEEVVWAKMARFISEGSSFVRALALATVQFVSHVPDAPLAPLAPSVKLLPGVTDNRHLLCLSLAAGLPHFASGVFRNWGRDTFIALRGCLLLPGRYFDARVLILTYAGTLRHGLIPNLLGGGTGARYNCRDAVWFWLRCIHDFCTMVPKGECILQDSVTRMYPTDDDEPCHPGTMEQPLCDVMQEALQRHAEGISYRERNAGKEIDADMSDQGFDVSVHVDWETGFVCGGSEHNCGTWMDKNGSAPGNKGRPATPRDGAAVELVALCKSVVSWLADLHSRGQYPHGGVQRADGSAVTFAEWAALVQCQFETKFWVPRTVEATSDPRPDLINKRGIYKDTVGATAPWCDYQLRPNVSVAMVVAPELFTAENAWHCLDVMNTHLLGPLGMRTLDPSDWNYNGNYVNSDASGGWNYHQGPEWVWPLGFFLRARLHFAQQLEPARPGLLGDTVRAARRVLSAHNTHIHESPWKSLPELTNKNGARCADSCEAQAWSVGGVLEALYDLEVVQAQTTPPSAK